MKVLLSLVSCVVIAYGCKPVDHSESEEKGLRTLLKKGAKHLSSGGQLSDETLAGIGKISKNADPDSAYFKKMKKILAKGGSELTPDADKAILAYRRGYTEQFEKIIERMGRHGLMDIREGLPVDIKPRQVVMEKFTSDLEDQCKKMMGMFSFHRGVVKDLVTGITDQKKRFEIANRMDIGNLYQKKLFEIDISIRNIGEDFVDAFNGGVKADELDKNMFKNKTPTEFFEEQIRGTQLMTEKVIHSYDNWLNDLASKAGVPPPKMSVEESALRKTLKTK